MTAVVVAGCSSSSEPAPAPEPTTTAIADFPTPPYQLQEDREGYATAYVVDQYSDDELSRVFFDINDRFKQLGKTGGWFVSINCKGFDGQRLANGKLAYDSLGIAQTGMSSLFPEFEVLPSRQDC